MKRKRHFLCFRKGTKTGRDSASPSSCEKINLAYRPYYNEVLINISSDEEGFDDDTSTEASPSSSRTPTLPSQSQVDHSNVSITNQTHNSCSSQPVCANNCMCVEQTHEQKQEPIKSGACVCSVRDAVSERSITSTPTRRNLVITLPNTLRPSAPDDVTNPANGRIETCRLCKMQVSDLPRHIRSHSPTPLMTRQNETNVECIACNVYFDSSNSLAKHNKRFHVARPGPYKCFKCQLSFPFNGYLIDHLKFYHKVTAKPFVGMSCSEDTYNLRMQLQSDWYSCYSAGSYLNFRCLSRYIVISIVWFHFNLLDKIFLSFEAVTAHSRYFPSYFSWQNCSTFLPICVFCISLLCSIVRNHQNLKPDI